MFNNLIKYMAKPKLFAIEGESFWNEEHISKRLLEAHLNPGIDAASRKESFLKSSVKWITEKASPMQHTKLLDLGCGPGLYAEQFSSAGYDVIGIDFSKRSIAYAKEQTLINRSNIDYSYQNYLTIDYKEEFDIVTLIYCDFGALPTKDREHLLKKVYRALKPGGKFILDVFSINVYKNKCESRSWEYCENGGFWSKEPYICLNTVYHYDEDHTELRQSIVQTEEGVCCYNIWEHFFTKDSLMLEMKNAGFEKFEIYGDIAGKEFLSTDDTICGIFIR